LWDKFSDNGELSTSQDLLVSLLDFWDVCRVFMNHYGFLLTSVHSSLLWVIVS